MEVISNSYMPGDLRLVEQLVSELKSQGIFDQFRKECIADVDTKPAYQNLRQRVEGTVTTFLKQQTWNVELNKNQLREHLRKNLYESGFLETGVERIVDQVVNPKISTVFLPKVEEVVYKFLGVEKPNNRIKKEEKKVSITDLLPTDLEAVSPESSECSFKHEKKTDNQNDSLNSSGKMDEDESPAFEPLGNITTTDNDPLDEDNKMQLDENSHSSEISGSQNNEALQKTEMRNSLIDSSNQDSQNSMETRLSIVTSEDTTKMEICEDSSTDNKNDGKFEEGNAGRSTENVFSFKDFKKDEPMVSKASERTSESDKKDKRSKSSDKYRDKKDDRHRKSSSSRDRDKYSSKHSSHKTSKDRDSYKKDSRDKDRSKERNDRERDRSSKYDREKSKSGKDKKSERSKESSAKDEKDQDKYKQEKSKSEKEKSNKDKPKSDKDNYARGNEKDYSKNKEKSDKDKEKYAKDKHKEKDNDKDKNRTSSSSNNSNNSKHGVAKDKKKDSNHSSDKKEKHNKESADSKSKSTEKKKKDETNKHDSNKKEPKDPKKKSKDDHYSSKIKKNDRRSTDRDSNDGASSKNNDTESMSSRSESNSQEHSNSSFSGSGDSGNSDQAEPTNKAPSETSDNSNKLHPVKYMKPKFASNINEAMKIMKIRKQLARLEKQNQLSLSTIDLSNKNGSECSSNDRLLLKEILANNEVNKMKELDKEVLINNVSIMENAELMEQPVKRANLSMENFEALEAKLAQVMSHVNYNSYESDEDYEVPEYTSNNPDSNLNKDTRNKSDDDLLKKDSSISENTKNNQANNNPLSGLECKDECLYLDKPSDYEEKNLKYLKNIISQFEEERDDKRGIKRKLDESIVFKNNIEMQYTDIVHNRRDSNSSNKVGSKANKKRMCNNTDITPDEHFSLPLSPAESDKSGDRKEEDLLIPTKQKRIIRGYSQRYSSEDLYKPRPVIGRRNKFPRHVDN
ncbi:unnamed protein product [Phyllotreta striolata]|uniref:BOD1/SHG1 domain-containing protein n=1 Tax=Phyllotreta striolata TaxID=444603 RepID=A0A9N9TJH3_PHYSR|nr:unnamed protein product [Phyllotreta striolata]